MVLALSPDEVHIWSAPLDRPGLPIPQMVSFLSMDEHLRADRYRSELDRWRFLTRRAILRVVLAAYLDVTPRDLCFVYSVNGKPSLVPSSSGREPLRFSVSHSDGFALYAVTHSRDVGVDVEHIRPIPDAARIADRFFSPGAREMLSALPEDQLLVAFFACWTRNEAYVKARGLGLLEPFNGFDLSPALSVGRDPLQTEGDDDEPARWSLRDVVPCAGYLGAVAVEGGDYRILSRAWPKGLKSSGILHDRSSLASVR